MNTALFSLKGKTALIAGAAGGVGEATASALAALGADLVLCDRQPTQTLADRLAEAGAAVTSRLCDVSKRADIEAVVADCPRLDAAVYTAAVCPWDDWRAADWDDAFEAVVHTNLKGAIDFSRAAMAKMADGGGRIVLVSSLAGRNGGLIASPHYVATKGGINALVKWLAGQGAANGILVNGIAPASIRTPMMTGQHVDLDRIPLGRMAEPAEVAGPIAFLCAPASSYMTGTLLDVNGGVYMS